MLVGEPETINNTGAECRLSADDCLIWFLEKISKTKFGLWLKVFIHWEFTWVFVNPVLWAWSWMCIQLLRSNFFCQTDDLDELPCWIVSSIQHGDGPIQAASTCRLHILYRDEMSERSESRPKWGLSWFNVISVYLLFRVLGPFFYLLAPEVNFPGDLCVIKQYYLFVEPQQGKQISFLTGGLVTEEICYKFICLN